MQFWRLEIWAALAAICISAGAQGQKAYQYFRVGAAADLVAKPRAGFALMGGGTDLDEAFRWMCERAGGGDFLVLRAAGTDAYNPYVAGLEDGKDCRLNSVATLVIPDKAAANDPFVAEAIAHAEAIFIAGGDQANYIRYWTGTPVQAGINAAIARGVTVGGTSAGLAVMGEWVYSAEGDKPGDPNLDSSTALMNPLGPRVTLVRGFLEIPVLKGIITDSHFVKRDRMGRLLVFLARIGDSGRLRRGIGVDEKSAVLIDGDGHASVVGNGDAYFVDTQRVLVSVMKDMPLSLVGAAVLKVAPGHTFNLETWRGDGTDYVLSVEKGKVRSTQPRNSIY
jgi:cyanophycinase